MPRYPLRCELKFLLALFDMGAKGNSQEKQIDSPLQGFTVFWLKASINSRQYFGH